MKEGYKKGLAALAFAAAALWSTAGTAQAQQDAALVDALVKKGVLSQDEASEIEASLQKDYAQSSAGKLQLSSFISKLQLYGDARLRYEYLNARGSSGTAGTPNSGNPNSGNNNDRDRFRYRLRLGATYVYDSHWSAGIRLESGTSNNSSNVDFGRYFDKYGDGINIGLIYLEYQNQFSLFDETSTVADGKSYKTVTSPGVNVGLDVRVGKAPKQILLSEAFWDADTNPEGVSEEVSFNNVGVDGLSLYARGGEYFVSLPNQSSYTTVPAPNNNGNQIGSLLVGQLEAKYAWDSSSNVRVAPLFLTETSSQFVDGATAAATSPNNVAGNQEASGASATGITAGQPLTGVNPYNYTGRLAVVAIPIEVNFKLWGLPHQIFGTWGANLEGDDRLRALGFAGEHGRNTFWNAGYQIGQSKKKGDWMASVEWRWIEAASYTTNLSDSDWGNNFLNQQGVVARAGYNLTDFLFGQVSYQHSNPINGGAANFPQNGYAPYATASTAFGGQVDRVQVDLTWKF